METAPKHDKHGQRLLTDISAPMIYPALKVQGDQMTFTRKWTGRFQMPSRDKTDPHLTYLMNRYGGADK